MKPAEMSLLERAFASEISSALEGGPNIFQIRSNKLAEKLVESGHLEPRELTWGSGVFAVRLKGYGLTHIGRFTYCASCGGES